jgi:hypothetical protein
MTGLGVKSLAAIAVLFLFSIIVPSVNAALPLSTNQAAAIVLGQGNFITSTHGGASYSENSPFVSNAFDPEGDLWVSDNNNNRILEYKPPFTTNEAASAVIGQTSFNTVTSGATPNTLHNPAGIAFDSAGDLWVSDASNNRVLEFPPGNQVTNGNAAIGIGVTSLTGVGGTGSSYITTGNTFWDPTALVFDSHGNLWVSDTNNHRVEEFPPGNQVLNGYATNIIGQINSVSGGLNGYGDTANTLHKPFGLAFDPEGDLWVSDLVNNRVLEFIPMNQVTNGYAATVIGQANFITSGSGTTGNTLNSPEGIAFDRSGDLWVIDNANYRILEFPPANQVTNAYATNVIGQTGFSTKSSGTTANTLNLPQTLTFDSSGNLWVSDTNNNRILEYGITTLIATPNPYTLSNTMIDVDQVSTANTVITNGAYSTTSYTANWLWVPPASSGISISNTIAATLSTTSNAPTLTIKAFSSNSLEMTFNGVVYWANAIGTNTIAGTWTFNAFAGDADGDTGPTPALTNTITISNTPFGTLSAPSNTPLESGQTETYTVTTANGVGPFIANLILSGSVVQTENIPTVGGSNTFSFTPPFGIDAYNVIITDIGATTPFVFNTLSNTVTVSNAPSATLGVPTNIMLNLGQTESYTVVAANGVGPFIANLILSGSVVQTENILSVGGSNTFSFTPPVGTDAYNAILTDIGPTTQFVFNTLSNTVVVANAPTVNITAAATSLHGGQSDMFVANIPSSNGIGPYSGNLVLAGLAVAPISFPINGGQNSVTVAVPAGSGSYSYNFIITDIGATTAFVFNSPSVIVGVTNPSSGSGVPQLTATFSDNINTNSTISSASPVFIAYVVGGTQTYYQNQLPVTVTSLGSTPINFSFACSVEVGANMYTYQNTVYGLGTGQACNKIYTVTAGSYTVIYSLTGQSNATSTTVPTTTTAITTTTIPVAPTTIPASTSATATVSIIVAEPTLLNFSSQSVSLSLTSQSNTVANVSVSNITQKQSSVPPGYQKLLIVNFTIQTSGNVSSEIALHYPCNIQNTSTIAPYILQKGAWVPVQYYATEYRQCEISFAVTNSSTVALFIKTLAPSSTTSIKPVAVSTGYPAWIIPTVVIAAVVVAAVVYALRVRKKGKAPDK